MGLSAAEVGRLRAVRRRLLVRAAWPALVGVVSAALLAAFSFAEHRTYTGLREHGVTVDALVVDIVEGRAPRYVVAYTTQSGDQVTASLYHGRGRLGERLQVEYDSTDPTSVTKRGVYGEPFWGLLAILAAVSLIVGVSATALRVRWTRRLAAAFRGGTSDRTVVADLAIEERLSRPKVLAAVIRPATGQRTPFWSLELGMGWLAKRRFAAKQATGTLLTATSDPHVAALRLSDGLVYWPLTPLKHYDHEWEYDRLLPPAPGAET